LVLQVTEAIEKYLPEDVIDNISDRYNIVIKD
jgi:hypothetical protein